MRKTNPERTPESPDQGNQELMERETNLALETHMPPPNPDELDSEEKVRLMVKAADAVRAMDIIALDLRGLTIISDFFLICTGKSSIQIRAIADRIEGTLRNQGIRRLRVEGYQEATWILLDYGDVVAHIMAEEQRAFYNLEAFWANAPHLHLELTPEATLTERETVRATETPGRA